MLLYKSIQIEQDQEQKAKMMKLEQDQKTRLDLLNHINKIKNEGLLNAYYNDFLGDEVEIEDLK